MGFLGALAWLVVCSLTRGAFPSPSFLPSPGGFSRWVGCVLFSLGWLVSCSCRGWFFRFSVACLSLGGLCFCLVWLPVVHVVVSSPLRGVAGVLVLSYVGSARWGHEH